MARATPPRPRLIKIRQQQLGDMLQRLATISPSDVFALTRLVRSVLTRAEVEHRKRFQGRDPTMKAGAFAIWFASQFWI